MKSKKILLIGDVIEDSGYSMKEYLIYLKKLFKEADIISPSSKINPKIYKILIYPTRLFQLRKKYDIYHIIDHSYSYLINFLPKNKTVITCHDLIPLRIKNFLSVKSILSFKYYISGLKKAKKIIAVSENTKKDLIEILRINPKKIEVIPTKSIDRRIFKKLNKKALRKKHKLEKRKIILHVGNLFYKNTVLILKALKELKKEIKNIFFIKVGKFTKEELEFIKNNQLGDYILNKENVSKKELVELYNISDIFIFPSLYEGFGIPLLEAMACGIPIITSNTSSIPEVVDNAAIKINPQSKEELINSIKKLLKNKKTGEKFIKEGHQNLKRFNDKEIKKMILKVYREITKCAG